MKKMNMEGKGVEKKIIQGGRREYNVEKIKELRRWIEKNGREEVKR